MAEKLLVEDAKAIQEASKVAGKAMNLIQGFGKFFNEVFGDLVECKWSLKMAKNNGLGEKGVGKGLTKGLHRNINRLAIRGKPEIEKNPVFFLPFSDGKYHLWKNRSAVFVLAKKTFIYNSLDAPPGAIQGRRVGT